MTSKEGNNGESGKNTEQQLVSPTPGEMKENEGKKETAASGASTAVGSQTNVDQDVVDQDNGKHVSQLPSWEKADFVCPGEGASDEEPMESTPVLQKEWTEFAKKFVLEQMAKAEAAEQTKYM